MGDEFDQYKVQTTAPVTDEFAQYKVNAAPLGGTPEQRAASGSMAPQLNSYWDATKYGASELASGAADIGKGIWGMIKPPSMQELSDSDLNPVKLLVQRGLPALGNLAKQATQVPGAIKDLYNSPDPLGSLALAAPRALGQGAAQSLVSAGSEALPGTIDSLKARFKPSAPVEAPRPQAPIPPVSYKGTQVPEPDPQTAAAPPVKFSINDLKQRAAAANPPPVSYSVNDIRAAAPQTPEGIAADRYQVVPLSGPKTPAAGPDPYTGPRTPPMEPAQSTTIASHGYHGDSQTMVVQFKNGKVYEYRGVPQNVYNQYQQSESQGSYFSQNIKGRYQTAYRGIVKPTPGQQVTQALGGPR